MIIYPVTMKRIAVLAGCLAVAAAVFFGGHLLARAQAPLDEKALAARLKLRDGWSFAVFADGLGTPRLMALAANGDLIVTIHRYGLVAVVRADRDGDGKSDGRTALAHGLDVPHGVLLEGADLYVAEEHRVRRYHFDGVGLTDAQTIVDGMPAGGGHSTRTLKRGPDGKLYIAIGSSCNVCLEDHPLRATIARLGDDGRLEVFAAGLRNTVGFDWQPETGSLYGVDNGRDRLGDDVPPDELNRIEEGRHYGWPYRFGMNVDDPQFGGGIPEDLITTPPVHRFAAHVAPLSIRFLKASRDPGLKGSALVTKHGSWNRSRKVGYAIAALKFSAAGKIEELPFLEGCHKGERVFCRPVDVLEAPDGSLYVSDDFTGAIYKLTYTAR